MPVLYIIAGPNGAGKTTSAETLLPGILDCTEFVNADLIARGISPYNPESVAIQAGRIMLSRINELMHANTDMVIETTLSTLSYANFVKECKQRGYNVILLFVWLEEPQIAKNRVRQRVEKGGHNIPEDVIERRYHKGIKNLNKIFLPLCDEWMITDNSYELEVVARKDESGTKIFNLSTYKLICHE